MMMGTAGVSSAAGVATTTTGKGHLIDACFGSISEIFDGDPLHKARGCRAQAWQEIGP
jgi:glycogen debranching enzyme